MRARLMAALGAMVMLSGCEVTVDEGPRPGPDPRYCPRIYAPVCAGDRDGRDTYPNACEARADGARIFHEGACRRHREEEPRFCTREYAPVCAERGGRERTFGNSCEAEAAGWDIVAPGRC